MSSKNAERQAKYRETHLKSEDGTQSRLNMVIDMHAKLKLERLAVYYAVTQKEVLERILSQAEAAVTDDMHGDQANLYFDKNPLLRNED
jgi:hypothetical protein